MWAIVEIGGKQYKVFPGQTVVTDKLFGKVGETLSFTKVLLVDENGKVKIGTPQVAAAKVTAKILAQEKGEKLEIRRFKAKVRYRRHKGFRVQQTKLQIVAIS